MSKILTLKENVKLVYEEAAKEILRCTPQLYVYSELEKKIEPLGSGVLFQKNNDFYLFTAGHCIKQKGKEIPIGILDNGDFRLLRGKVIVEQGIDCKTDIAILKLDLISTATCQRNYRFITQKDFFKNFETNRIDDYLVVGFPITRTQINHSKKKIKIEPFVYLMKSKEIASYLKLSFNFSNNLLLGFSQRHSQFFMEDKMNMSPDPKGISGCVLWYIPSYFTSIIEVKLAGIMIEHYKERSTVVATKIELFQTLICALDE